MAQSHTRVQRARPLPVIDTGLVGHGRLPVLTEHLLANRLGPRGQFRRMDKADTRCGIHRPKDRLQHRLGLKDRQTLAP
ncbi:MAG: hypothetical protein WCO04_00085 [Pseudomonadota bacterium]